MSLDPASQNGSVMVTKLDDLLNWARLSSLWPMSFGIACCAIEMMGSMASTYDLGSLRGIPRPSPGNQTLLSLPEP